MFIFLAILILLAAVFLILVVVIQNSKGGGLAAGFDSSNKYMGVRKTTDFLEKTTWWLAGTLVLLSIASTHFLSKHQGKGQEINQAVRKVAEKQQNTPAAQPFGIGNTTEQATTSEEAPAEAPTQE